MTLPVLVAGCEELAERAGASSLGAYLSVACRDQAPFTHPRPWQQPQPGTPPTAPSPAIPTWPPAVSGTCPPAPLMHQAIKTSVPILILTGQFDAFSPGPQARAAARLARPRLGHPDPLADPQRPGWKRLRTQHQECLARRAHPGARHCLPGPDQPSSVQHAGTARARGTSGDLRGHGTGPAGGRSRRQNRPGSSASPAIRDSGGAPDEPVVRRRSGRFFRTAQAVPTYGPAPR